MDSFGKKLREAREAKGYSQAELARQINSHHSIIGKYERDEVKPTIDVIKKLSEVLGATISFLMGETENQNAFKDPAMFKRMAEIENLPPKDKECLLLTVDNFIKATKFNNL
ncbi:MAG TPA: helix-turn-helix transcriptional regulator [Nostocaceae cyanobacterium]|nr:helix-turn-helix transcriptional regulator [Nostocaceae cyanobacterium]